jgi:hypothetical protein
MEIISNILSYNNRFVIRGLKIIQINKKYKNILSCITSNCLLNKSISTLNIQKRIIAIFRSLRKKIHILNTKRYYSMNYVLVSNYKYFYDFVLEESIHGI